MYKRQAAVGVGSVIGPSTTVDLLLAGGEHDLLPLLQAGDDLRALVADDPRRERRPDIGTGDVAMIFVLLVRQVPLPNEQDCQVASERCMALMLDGLRAHAGTALPAHPLSSADLGL